ncbi:hypothetical protein CRUP_022933, partial [Coryphaenoides rupestris]
LQTLLAEYLDSACALLSELLPFMGYQAQQVVSVLSEPSPPVVLSPGQSVLLFQRCGVLLAGPAATATAEKTYLATPTTREGVPGPTAQRWHSSSGSTLSSSARDFLLAR